MRLSSNASHRAFAILPFLVTLIACSNAEDDPAAPGAPVGLSESLTKEAAGALDESGQFILAQPSAGQAELTAPQAVKIAGAWARQFAPRIRRTLERERDGSIAFERLEPCGRPLYAESAFEALPAEMPAGLRRPYESRWLVGLCDGKELQVSLAIAAGAADLSVVDGTIRLGAERGGEFFSLGVPANWESPVGLAPERAVQLAAVASGRRIAKVPRLIAASPLVAYPQGSAWEVELESPVQARGDRSRDTRQTGRIYAGFHARVGKNREIRQELMSIAALDQPTEHVMKVPLHGKNDARDSNSPLLWFTIRRRADRPVLLEQAIFDQER